MKLSWNFITDVTERTYVATVHDLFCGDKIEFKDTIGHIVKNKDGTWSAFDGYRWLGNEPNKKFAMDIVKQYADKAWRQKRFSE